MTRTAIAVALALAALALLALLALDSRPIPIDAHVAQHTLTGEIERSAQDFAALVAAFKAAQAGNQAPGEGARALLDRISERPEALPPALFGMRGSASREARLTNAFTGYKTVVDEAVVLATDVFAGQTAYAAGVDFVRANGPRIIESMRDRRLERAAIDTFQLVVGTLDFAAPNASVRDGELRRLLATLGRDERIDGMPADFPRLRASIETVVATKASLASKLEQLATSPLDSNAEAVTQAASALYVASVARVDQARLMLAAYAVVLLLAVGLVAFRLHGSYRELNRTNAALASFNESLEQRVTERTEELAGTVAELKESQVQLVQAEKMSSLGQLVAGISHEINTPLLYLANNAELLAERLGLLERFVTHCSAAFSIRSEECRDRAEYQARFVHALKDVKTMLRDDDLVANLQEARDLTRDSIAGLAELTEMAQSLKDFSRLDRAPVARFDVNSGLDKTLLIARNIVKHKANVLKLYGEIPEIECSPSQINQVFLNIVTNAAQAIETQGEIVITTRLHDAERVAIRIADTGCGIPPENLSKIRDPFFTTKEVGTGTGLGLSIVDEIVRSHGGELLIESEVGKGSAFTVVLPIHGARKPAEPPAGDGFDEPPLLAEAV